MSDTKQPKNLDASPIGTGDRGLLRRLMGNVFGGFLFGGKRNLYDIFGYPRTLKSEELIAKYSRQDITSRIVDTPPEETWSYPPEIITKDRAFAEAWSGLLRLKAKNTVDLWPTLMQADKMCAFGPYSAIWLGLPGDPAKPAGKAYNIQQLSYANVFGATNVDIAEWEKTPSSPRYGLPLVYSCTTAGANMVQRVHYTRIVHIVDRPLQGKTIGIPRLEQIYNVLDDIMKVAGGSAETFWLTANRGMQVDVDKEMQLTTEDADSLAAEVEEFQHQLRRYIRTRGVKVTALGSDVADPTGVFSVLIALLASATGIPQRILMGAEAGQLASEQDRANWSEYITRRRNLFATPFVFRVLVERLIALGMLPQTEEPVELKWPSAFHQSPLEEAQTQAQFARSVVNLSRQAKEGFAVVTLEEARKALGVPEEVPEGQELPQAPKPAPVVAPTEPQDKPATKANESDEPKLPNIIPFKPVVRTLTGPKGEYKVTEENIEGGRRKVVVSPDGKQYVLEERYSAN